jgi:transcription initiation factor TFIIIB Brf1 subunit/transcription initiation factor TFIIB
LQGHITIGFVLGVQPADSLEEVQIEDEHDEDNERHIAAGAVHERSHFDPISEERERERKRTKREEVRLKRSGIEEKRAWMKRQRAQEEKNGRWTKGLENQQEHMAETIAWSKLKASG